MTMINEGIKDYLNNEPVNGPSFITPEGKFLRCPGDAHLGILNTPEYKDKYRNLKDFCNDTGYIRVNDGSILYWEVYITLTKKEPTAAQYEALTKYLDYLMMTRDTNGVSVDCLSSPMEFQSYDWDYTDVDDIIKRIKEFYKTGKLREDLHEKLISTERFDFYITESPYEVKNILLNSKEPMRVYIDENIPLYLVGNAYECTHTDMVNEARKEYPELHWDDYDKKKVCAVYAPVVEWGEPEYNEQEAKEDDYGYGFYFSEPFSYYVFSRYNDFKNFALYKVLGKGHRFVIGESFQKLDEGYVNFTDTDLDKLEDKIITAMDNVHDPFDDEAQYFYPYEYADRGFITRDGGIIDTFGNKHYDLEFNIQQWLEKTYSDDKYFDMLNTLFNKSGLAHTVTDALGWIRVNGSNEDYICLPTSRPNDKQLDSLEKWLDEYFAERDYHDSIDVVSSDGRKQVTFKPTNTGKDIIKAIKRFYTSGELVEELVDKENLVYAFTSPYEVKNLISRNDRAYRILWDAKQKLYLVGDHYNIIHMDMIEKAIEQGYYPGLKRWEIPGYMDELQDKDKICIAIYTPNDKIKDTYGATLEEDDYNSLFQYENGVITTRDSEWKKCPLAKAMGPYKKHVELSPYEQDELGGWHRHPIEMEGLKEELLTEKTRQELINKSKDSDDYSKNNQAKGRNRWERRRFSQIAASVRDYNRIDMDAFWKGDILEFGVKVHGETDDYVVTILFEDILRNLQEEVKSNNNKLEFKCVLRALLRSFNGQNVYVSCTCPDWKYRQAYWATKNQQNSGAPEVRPSDITNPTDSKGAGCKHVNLVISNADWMMKIASVINNYIKWTKENMGRNYADYIFPKVYGMPYNRAVQLSLFDDMDSEESGLLPSDQKTLDTVIDKSMQGRNDKGQWDTGNDYRFQKKTPKNPVDNEDQLKLDLEFPKKKVVKEPEIKTEVEIEDEKNIRPEDVNIKASDLRKGIK